MAIPSRFNYNVFQESETGKKALLGLLVLIMVLPLAAWPATQANLKSKCPDARIIVPGHGDPGGPELIEHILKLLAANTK